MPSSDRDRVPPNDNSFNRGYLFLTFSDGKFIEACQPYFTLCVLKMSSLRAGRTLTVGADDSTSRRPLLESAGSQKFTAHPLWSKRWPKMKSLSWSIRLWILNERLSIIWSNGEKRQDSDQPSDQYLDTGSFFSVLIVIFISEFEMTILKRILFNVLEQLISTFQFLSGSELKMKGVRKCSNEIIAGSTPRRWLCTSDAANSR